MNPDTVFLYFKWHYFERTKLILKGWKNILVFNMNYFSVPFLLKTFFSPWRKYSWSYGRGFDPGRFFMAFSSNLISRTIGSFIRFIFIIIGFSFEVVFFFLGLVIFFLWVLMPFILIYLLFFSFRLIF
jgi:hypothetical protein